MINRQISWICNVVQLQSITLSPVLFNIHLNDIKFLKLKRKIVCYAGDTELICIGITWNEIIKNIEVVLKSIYNWLSDNTIIVGILLNWNKSTILLDPQLTVWTDNV